MPRIKAIAGAAVLAVLAVAASAQTIPSSIESEHQALHAQLAKVVGAGGRTGAAAREVEMLLAPHFHEEEQYALPPLGLLADLAAGKLPADTASVIRMTDRLKERMPDMLREHKEIAAAAQRLRTAGQQERKPAAVAYVDGLLAHAKQEEEVLYPSAILVGEYLKQKR